MTALIKYLVAICCSIFSVSCACGQSFTLSGNVKAESQSLPFATVQLNKLSDSTWHMEAWTDTAGKFGFNNVPRGTYQLCILALGYRKFESDVIDLTTDQYLTIELEVQSNQLNEVVIASKKNLYETGSGKLTFHVKNSAMTSGQTTFDMLRKLPGVSVGQNDQLLFRGSTEINVMINGKMTYLSGNQLINLLKGISAQDLNKIELVTTPMAEFDAAGNAGIINIVTKKSVVKGYAVDLRSGISKGKNLMTNQNISASLGTGKLNLYGSFDYNTPQTFSDDVSGNTLTINGNTIAINRKNDNLFKSKYYTRHLEVDWQVLPRHRLTAVYHGYLDDWKGYKNSTINTTGTGSAIASKVITQNLLTEPYYYDSGTLGYNYKIDSTGKKITADANYTSYRNYSDGIMTTNNYNAQGNYLYKSVLKSYQPGFINIFSIKADADLPLQNFRLKAGLKYATVANDNQFRFDSLQAGNFVEVIGISNHFKYKEHIAAVYASASGKFNKTSIEAGLRVEYTNANGYTLNQNVSNVWAYNQLFPSLAVAQVINDDHKLDLSVTFRLASTK